MHGREPVRSIGQHEVQGRHHPTRTRPRAAQRRRWPPFPTKAQPAGWQVHAHSDRTVSSPPRLTRMVSRAFPPQTETVAAPALGRPGRRPPAPLSWPGTGRARGPPGLSSLLPDRSLCLGPGPRPSGPGPGPAGRSRPRILRSQPGAHARTHAHAHTHTHTHTHTRTRTHTSTHMGGKHRLEQVQRIQGRAGVASLAYMHVEFVSRLSPTAHARALTHIAYAEACNAHEGTNTPHAHSLCT